MSELAAILAIIKQIIEILEDEQGVAGNKIKKVIEDLILDDEYSEKMKLPDEDEWDDLSEILSKKHELEEQIVYQLILKACAAASPEEYGIDDFEDKDNPGEIDKDLLQRVTDKTRKKFRSWARRQLREVAYKKILDAVS